jgi:Fe-Mn family superoxide dismutase
MQSNPASTRRESIAAATAGLTAPLASTTAPAANPPVPAKETAMTAPAFQTSDTLKPLSFDPSKLKGLSERMIRSHWENNYGGSVKALAAVKAAAGAGAGDKDLPPTSTTT